MWHTSRLELPLPVMKYVLGDFFVCLFCLGGGVTHAHSKIGLQRTSGRSNSMNYFISNTGKMRKWSFQFTLVPWPIGSSGGHDKWFSRDSLPVCSAKGHFELFWHGQRCPLFHVVHPTFPLPAMASPILQGVLKNGFGEALVACDMPGPCKFPSLDNCQKTFLWTYKEVDLAPHPVIGAGEGDTELASCWILTSCRPNWVIPARRWPWKALAIWRVLFGEGDIERHNKPFDTVHYIYRGLGGNWDW